MRIRIPGDKSISQRGLILSCLAQGESRLRGLVPGGDPGSTAGALRALGVSIPPTENWGREVRIGGVGLTGLTPPEAALDVQNSGTGARLLLGVLAGHPFEAVVTGDESLRGRPMGRITQPLTEMGAKFRSLEEPGRLPIRVSGGPLKPFEYRLPVASAQVKSALILAGLVGGVDVDLIEPGRSRDHTETMLRAAGVDVLSGSVDEGGWRVRLASPPKALEPLDLQVPGDFSSAAFLILLGLLRHGPDPLVLEGVGLNETRTGLLPVLRSMGAKIREENVRGFEQGEPFGDLVVEPSELVGGEVTEHEVPRLIDEVPILAVGALRAQGETRITGARELRVKETDRIRALVENIRAIGGEVEELDDGLVIQGSEKPLSGNVRAFGDHRIAMAFGILGALPGSEVFIDDPRVAGVSFPGFWDLLARIREPTSLSGESRSSMVRPRPPVITLDGPAGSGKSSTAREVAKRLGYRHLDSGALYRALTFALLSSGIPEDRWPEMAPEEFDQFPIRLRVSEGKLQVMLGDRVLEEELRTPEVTSRVSPLSAIPAVRRWLLEAQRRTGREGGLVADGRDMGTVVFPDAEVKIFLTAELYERARRRFLEREGREPDEDEVSKEAAKIQERDARDSARAVAPLKKPEGSSEVDTSDLGFDEQVQAIIDHVKTLTDK